MHLRFCLPVSFALSLSVACNVEEQVDRDDPVSTTDDPASCSPAITTSDLFFERSFAVTDAAVLDPDNDMSPFSLNRTLSQLVTQANVPGLTAEALFKQWWDTQNEAPGSTTGPHCNDQITGATASFNRYPWMCPRSGEGQLASEVNPLSSASPVFFRPIGLFNRFDLAPSSGENCGEARIVYASRRGRLLAIFEAKIPNPTPGCVQGCLAVVNFWKNLSTDREASGSRLTADTMKSRLSNFYYVGLPGFGPVIHINNFMGSSGPYNRGSGQIRTNEFHTSQWELREFNGLKTCGSGGCRYQFLPATTKGNPAPLLFGDPNNVSDPTVSAQVVDFQNRFVNSEVQHLAVGDINTFFMDVPNNFNSGSSNMAFTNPNDYSFTMSPELVVRLDARLVQLQSQGVVPAGLGAGHIIRRATAMSCGGCHFFSSGADLGPGVGSWPLSNGFTHIDEFTTPQNSLDGNGQAFNISSALRDVFLPRRRTVMVNYYNSRRCTTCPSPSPSSTPSVSTSGSSLRAAEPTLIGGERTVH